LTSVLFRCMMQFRYSPSRGTLVTIIKRKEEEIW
jgi:hypothetical protein